MAEGTNPQRSNLDPLHSSTTTAQQAVATFKERVDSAVKSSQDQARDQVSGVASDLRSFDVRQQVAAHPWVALGVAALGGYVLGSMGGHSYQDDSPRPSTDGRSYPEDSPRLNLDDHETPQHRDLPRPAAPPATPERPRGTYQGQQARYVQPAAQAKPDQGGMWDAITDQFGGELRTLTTATVGSVVSMLRDTLKESVPQFAEEYERRRSGRSSAAAPSAPPVSGATPATSRNGGAPAGASPTYRHGAPLNEPSI